MCGYISNWPLEPWHWTDGQQGWWRVVTDNARKKWQKLWYPLHSNNCLVNANNCSAMIAELGEGWGHGEEARAVTWECDAWQECDMLLCDELLIGLCHCHHSLMIGKARSSKCSKHCDNCAEEITVITFWLSHSSQHLSISTSRCDGDNTSGNSKYFEAPGVQRIAHSHWI